MATKKNSKRRAKRDHVPSLSPEKLKLSLITLKAADNIPVSGKKAISRIMRAASNPDSERPDVVIRTLDAPRRQNVGETQRTLSAFTGGIARRGADKLMEMSDEEWLALSGENDENDRRP